MATAIQGLDHTRVFSQQQNGNAAPVKKKKDGWDIITEYTNSAAGIKNLFAKPIIIAYDIAKLHGHVMSEAEKGIYHAAKDVKAVITVFELPDKINKLRESIEKLNESVKKGEGVPGAIAKVFVKATGIIDPVNDGVQFLNTHGIISVPPDVLKVLGGMNSAALAIGMGDVAIESGKKIAAECEKIASSGLAAASTSQEVAVETEKVEGSLKKIGLDLMHGIKAVSYVALGIIGVLAAFFAILFASWIPVALAATALVFTLGGYFYDKIVDPNQQDSVRAVNPNPITSAPALAI